MNRENFSFEKKAEGQERKTYEDFSKEQLANAIREFSALKKRFCKEKVILEDADIEFLTEGQKKITSAFLEKIKNEWDQPIASLGEKKEVKNKYKNFFLSKFNSFCDTTVESLVNLVGRKVVDVKNNNIVLSEKFFKENLKFSVNEEGRIKVEISSDINFEKPPSLEELKSQKNKKEANDLFLDEDLPK